MNKSIKISVCIVTYNHQSFIEDCLTSILNQIVNFPIEIIVGDDASCDETPNKIMDLYKKFPDKIIPVLRKKNIGGHKNFIDVFERAQGKYIAYCEGDDYWNEPNKLQRQFDLLESNPKINLAFHPALEIDMCGKKKIGRTVKSKDNLVSVNAVVVGGGGFMHSSSLFIRREALIPFPPWFKGPLVIGDALVQIMASYPAGALFTPEPMSTYRRFVPNSMTTTNKRRGSWERIKRMEKIQENYATLSEYLGHRLTKEINKYFCYRYFKVSLIAVRDGEFISAVRSAFRSIGCLRKLLIGTNRSN